MGGTGGIRRFLLLAAWTWLFVFCFVDIETPGDYSLFVAFGRAVNEGSLVYDASVQARLVGDVVGHWATWPPGFAPFASVLAGFDGVAHAPAVVLFQLTNLAFLFLALSVIVTWLNGSGSTAGFAADESDGYPTFGGFRWDAPIVAAGLLVPFRLVLSNFEHAQVNLVVLGLVLAGFSLLDRRPWVGGLLFGIGSAIKATPILLLPYLAWRRRWKALGCACTGVAVAWIALPGLWLGPERMVEWWSAWIDALPNAGGQVSWMNQSLRSIAVLQLGSVTGPVLWLAGTVVLALAILFAFGQPFHPVGRRRAATEVAVLLAAITIVSPVSWKAHYVMLVPLCVAIFELGRTGLERSLSTFRRRLAFASLWIAALGINFSTPELIGWQAMQALERHGLILGCAVLLVLTGLWLLRSSTDRVADLRS